MSKIESSHLSEEALLRGIVDARDLTEQEREHVALCPVCSGSMRDLSRSLDALGEKAEANLPSPPSLPRLPARDSVKGRSFLRWVTGYRVWAGVTAAALAATILFWIGTPNQRGPETQRWWKQTETDMLFVSSESVQEELLPTKLAWLLDADSIVFDRQFMEFVAPFETESGEQEQNGGLS